jgi:ketosteroid isomerase-like protein
MVRTLAALSVALVPIIGYVTAQDSVPPDLAAMADTEREFARTASVKGWRDAFLDFFADDAIALTPQVASAKDRIRKQPVTPFSEFELVWEPRTGDVASSSDLGWLTGPSRSINHTSKDKKPGYGCYLSVWRKQPDGRWRVFIDVGADAPEPVPFAPGFTRIAFGNRYAGKEGKDLAGKSLIEADGNLNAQIAAQGAAPAFGERLTAASRLHVPGTVPIIGRDAITTWLDENATGATAQHGAGEASAAGDFAYSYGTYEITAPKRQVGAYVRLWSRDASGRWWLMVDVAQPSKSAGP